MPTVYYLCGPRLLKQTIGNVGQRSSTDWDYMSLPDTGIILEASAVGAGMAAVLTRTCPGLAFISPPLGSKSKSGANSQQVEGFALCCAAQE